MTSVCALIPAYNEAKVIATTIASVLAILPAEDIYIVDDGSTDSTAAIAATLIPHVLHIPNGGKATALNTALSRFELSRKYELILFLDADTQPRPDFLRWVLPHFSADTHHQLVCVVGRVKGLGHNWISRYRQWEYLISHSIHKKAQAALGCITVVPGCVTIYRSFVFDQVKFPTGTLTEDMDFTFQLHREGFNHIAFEDRAVVYVQDPQRLHDFITQISRWYTGFWQVVKKHEIPWHGQILDLEVSMLGLEGLYNGFIVLLFVFSIIPLTFMHRLSIFRFPLIIDLLVFFLPTLIWSSVSEKDLRYLLYLPHFYFLRLISSLIFLTSFFQGFIIPQKHYTWDSRRYLTN